MSEIENSERSDDRGSDGRQVAERERPENRLRPAVDIFEDDEAIHIVADVPGVTRKSLNLEVDENVLTIEGDIELDLPEGMSASYAEVRGSRFFRQFQLGREIDEENIRAEVRSGVLDLVLPKQERHRRRRIEVQSS